MTSRCLDDAGSGHASESDYRTYLIASGVVNHRSYVACQRAFRKAYPTLEKWGAAPLAERVRELRQGWGVPNDKFRSHLRPYLQFLVATGRTVLDWPWVIASGDHIFRVLKLPEAVENEVQVFANAAQVLGSGRERGIQLRRCIKMLHLVGSVRAPYIDAAINEARNAVEDFAKRPDRELFFSERHWASWRTQFRADFYAFHSVGFQLGRSARQPQVTRLPRRSRFQVPPRMEAVITEYLNVRLAQGLMPKTAQTHKCVLSHLADWLCSRHPAIVSFADVNRDHILGYMGFLADGSRKDQISRYSTINVFFADLSAWEWADAPCRPLISHRDFPKRAVRIPRYIPAPQLAVVMTAVRSLACPYQRTALLVARWSGARKGEVRWLERDCLDRYSDGTARLRIPAGKTRMERIIPLHEEAANALMVLQSGAVHTHPFADDHGHRAERLFVKSGRLLSAHYLFDAPLSDIAAASGMQAMPEGQHLTAHRFRHTVGTEMAEGGARLHTIMKMLGHTSTGMTLVYAHISDVAMREDYQKVLGPGARVAGSLADQLRAGAMPQASLDWIRLNFFKTELELGHCLRLPEEGPCECDLYLSCAKFVTTPEYAPRLRARRDKELLLIADASDRGFAREVERHQCTVRRIDDLLSELGERMPLVTGKLDQHLEVCPHLS